MTVLTDSRLTDQSCRNTGGKEKKGFGQTWHLGSKQRENNAKGKDGNEKESETVGNE